MQKQSFTELLYFLLIISDTMNILFVTGHPAQVHNFRLVREELIKKGHQVYWLTTNKDICVQLLNTYGIPHQVLKKPQKTFSSRSKTLLVNTFFVLKFLCKHKINIAITRTDPYTSVAAFLLRKKHIILDDTEHAAKMSRPFAVLSSAIILPRCYTELLRKDQLYFAGNIELFYLHKKRFTPSEPYSLLGIQPNEKYAIVRFVKWDAYHDKGLAGGFSTENKIELAQRLSQHVKVFITSEDKIPEALEPYQIHIPIERMHDVLAGASLFIGESATMASESVVLGTPAVYIDEVGRGYTDEECENGLLYMFRPNEQLASIDKAVQVVSSAFNRIEFDVHYQDFISQKIDPTAFLTWFIENYPESKHIMIKNPNYQYTFK